MSENSENNLNLQINSNNVAEINPDRPKSLYNYSKANSSLYLILYMENVTIDVILYTK